MKEPVDYDVVRNALTNIYLDYSRALAAADSEKIMEMPEDNPIRAVYENMLKIVELSDPAEIGRLIDILEKSQEGG